MVTARPDPDRRALRRWVAGLRRQHAEPLAAVAAVTRAIADHHGVAPPPGQPTQAAPPASPPPPPWRTPRLPGLVYEALAEPADRRARGAWFTPPAVVDGLVALALDDGFVPASVLDPACGGGAFLLGAADVLHRRGVAPDAVLDRLAGVDLDPAAIEVCRWSLDLWGAIRGVGSGRGRLSSADSLAADVVAADLVVGNPPFGTPLRADRATGPPARYREGRPHLGPYVDDAACFLDRAAGLVAPGGRLVLVLPQSLLASRDAAALVERLQQQFSLGHLWIAGSAVFDAAVHVFAPVLRDCRAGSGAGTDEASIAGTTGVGLHRGAAVTPAGVTTAGATWAAAAAVGLGVPDPPLQVAEGTLGRFASATSGFRDEHYGLAAACREAADRPGGVPVVTVGQIDPLCWIRDRPVRFGGRRWSRPVVDIDALSPSLAAWTVRQLRPKVLLATQSRVLEPLIDRSGRLVPSTPVIAVHADPDQLDRLAALLLAPPVVAWAVRRSIGTALQPQAIKLAARQVLEVPLPRWNEPWDEAAALLAHVDASQPAPPQLLASVAAAMCRAYGVAEQPLWDWWWSRLPRRRAIGPAVAEPAGRVGP